MKFKFDRMFSGVSATRQYAWAPSSDTVGGNEVDLETFNVEVEGADLEEGSGDSEENVNEDSENRNPRGVGGCICQVVLTQRVTGKEKNESTQSRELERKSHLELVFN